ncbi:MAG TPA: IPExxxVDY family protein [Bacteroidales bacterium]|nr:IPExxxVDY family protein [Bacteroidales bacterium]
MKESSKIRRVTLKVSTNEKWVLFGIVAAEPDYKLSLALNRRLGISLRNTRPLTIHDENESELMYSRFSNSSNSSGLVCELTSNHSGKNYLIRKLKNIDFFLLVHDFYEETDPETILSILRETGTITAVFKIDPDIIKDRNLKYLINRI